MQVPTHLTFVWQRVPVVRSPPSAAAFDGPLQTRPEVINALFIFMKNSSVRGMAYLKSQYNRINQTQNQHPFVISSIEYQRKGSSISSKQIASKGTAPSRNIKPISFNVAKHLLCSICNSPEFGRISKALIYFNQ